MPSLFSRSHQAPKKDRGPAVLVSNAPSGDRKLLGLSKTWSAQQQAQTGHSSVSEFGSVPHGLNETLSVDGASGHSSVFLTTNVPLSAQSVLSMDVTPDDMRMYGFLGGLSSKNLVLGLDEVARVIRDVGAELQHRALDTPMLFSNQSLELNQTRMRMLVQAFLGTVRTSTRTPTRTSIDTFAQDITFASDHELAWLLRWGLSRLTRIREATHETCHGCIDWDQYEEWRGRERAAKYPANAFGTIASILADDIYKYIIQPLFSLLSKFAAHSHNSGLTPHALASYFAPLLFDIPTADGYAKAHMTFVRAAAATEHLLLAFIRSSGDLDGLGVTDIPFRLREWIKGYPAMLASDADLARGNPRRAARVVKCEVATRAVRAYSRDLILNAETWVNDMPDGWPAWDRVVLKTRRGDAGRPKFSPNYRRRMVVKETLPLPQSRGHGEKIVYGMPTTRGGHEKEEEDDAGRYASLAGKEWSAFEEGGFDAPRTSGVGAREQVNTGDIRTRLQFDLNESAKMSVAERRQTMDWGDFADGGFTRTEPFLTASLTFSTPVQASITEWPKERDELRRRLQKTQKEATPFNYDTTPRIGPACDADGVDSVGRVTIEEAFIDCWSDLMMGSGWMERDELTFRHSSWAFIEYRARPSRSDGHDNGSDPRTSELCFLFEERVPLEYQMAVADPKRKKTLHGLFSKKKKSSANPPPVGWDARSQRSDFDRMLDRGAPRKIQLSRADQSVSSQLWQALADKPTGKSSPVPSPPLRVAASNKPTPPVPSAPKPLTKSATLGPDEPTEKGGKPNRIFKSIRRVKSGSDQRGTRQKQREVSMDFELQSASGISSGTNSPQDKMKGAPDQDKWMDILVANGARKMDREDGRKATTPTPTSPSSGPTALPGKMSTPSPTRDDITPTTTQFGAMSVGGMGLGLGLGLQAQHDRISPSSGSRKASNSSHGHGGSVDDHPGAYQDDPHDSPDPAMFGGAKSDTSVDRSSHGSSAPTTYSNSDDVSVHPSDSVSMRRHPISPPESPTTPVASGPAPPSKGLPTSSSYEGLISPQPRIAGQRDAITSIVDHYGEGAAASNRDSQATEYSEGDAYGGMARESFIERTYASERINSAYSLEEDLQQPPPIFDLTPGREPSPARYKHGEPLHFVGEEEEEEEEPEPEKKVFRHQVEIRDDYSNRARRF